MRRSKSVLLLLVTIGLVGTWAYHLYDKKDYSSHPTIIYIKDSTDALQATRDSLRNVFAATMTDLPESLDSLRYNNNSRSGVQGTEYEKINTLNNEIITLLHNEPLTNAGMLLASQKIVELKLESQHFQNDDPNLEEEKDRLNTLFREMSASLDEYQKKSKNN